MSLLEWTNKLLPQVSVRRVLQLVDARLDTHRLAGAAPVRTRTHVATRQGALVTGAKAGWNLAWQTMVKELAPQDRSGGYSRPSYAFDAQLGSLEFPVSAARGITPEGGCCLLLHGRTRVHGRTAATCNTRQFSPPLLLQAESGRYHVYTGNACPWCHRVLLTLALTGNRCVASADAQHMANTSRAD
jgi:hypothetical protein